MTVFFHGKPAGPFQQHRITRLQQFFQAGGAFVMRRGRVDLLHAAFSRRAGNISGQLAHGNEDVNTRRGDLPADGFMFFPGPIA